MGRTGQHCSKNYKRGTVPLIQLIGSRSRRAHAPAMSPARTFSLFVSDARYSVPTLMMVVAENEAQVRRVAHAELLASPNHLAVEVREYDHVLFSEARGPASA